MTVDEPETLTNYYCGEMDSLRKELVWTQEDSRTVERNVIIAIGLFLAFLLKENQALSAIPHHSLAWWIPNVFAVLGFVRSWSLAEKFFQAERYIRKIESHLIGHLANDLRPEGWGTFQHREEKHYRTISGLAFWAVLLFVTLVIAFLGPH